MSKEVKVKVSNGATERRSQQAAEQVNYAEMTQVCLVTQQTAAHAATCRRSSKPPHQYS